MQSLFIEASLLTTQAAEQAMANRELFNFGRPATGIDSQGNLIPANHVEIMATSEALALLGIVPEQTT